MDYFHKKSNPNPIEKAGFISKFLFLWALPIFKKGYTRDLNLEDLYDVPSDQRSSALGEKLEKKWFERVEKSEKSGKQARLLGALWSCFGCCYFCLFLICFVSECILRPIQSLLIREMVMSFNPKYKSNIKDQFMWTGLFSLTLFLMCILMNASFHGGYLTSMKCSTSCTSLVYRKLLRLSKIGQGKTTVGKLLNILSNDVNRFDRSLGFFPIMAMGPLQLTIYSFLLWNYCGPLYIFGEFIILMLCLVQYWNGKLSRKFRQRIAIRADERGRTMNEIVMAIRVIKLYAWEKPFGLLVEKLRKHEMVAARTRAYLRGVFLTLFTSSSKIVPYFTFLLVVLLDEEITAEKAFFSVAVYDALGQTIMFFLSTGVTACAEIQVCLKRIEEFLHLEEKNDATQENWKMAQAVDGEACINLKNACASWNNEKLHLENISLDCKGDKIVLIVGSVGSGKSTLLHALLGEIGILSGNCEIHGRVAYANQEPFLFSATVKQNILFGQDYEELKYARVVQAAALLEDFDQLPQGDSSLVGDRGIILSGGQKARVSFARMLYQDADIYLMDDMLSAVDSRVSRHLFDKAVKHYLQGKLRIVMTHQLQYLPEADYIVVLKEGKIAAQGTFKELQEKRQLFGELVKEQEKIHFAKSNPAPLTLFRPKHIASEKQSPSNSGLNKNDLSNLEDTIKGSIRSQVYVEYFKSGNSIICAILVISAMICSQIATTMADFWLAFWVRAEEEKSQGTFLGETTYLLIYGGIIASVLILSLLRAQSWFFYATRISVNLHDEMFKSIVYAPCNFFDKNTSGMILNRFQKDIGQIDEQIPSLMFESCVYYLQTLGVFVVVVVTNWIAVIPAIFVSVLCFFLRDVYFRTGRDVKRLEAMTKSFVFTYATSSFNGLTSIRAAKMETVLQHQFDSIQDIHSAAWYMYIVCSRSFRIWVDTSITVFLIVVAFGFLAFDSGFDGSKVGVAITSVVSVTIWVRVALNSSCEVSNLITSVERVLGYIDIAPEASSKCDKGTHPLNWPKCGIEFKNVSLSYDGEFALKNLNFSIQGKEKIGIVGRTGAGKSSIIQALFRLTESSGEILIDGQNINELELQELRKSISIIPQDPVLFSGTMRYNLDPFGEFEDEELWEVLEEVGLKDAIPDLSFKLKESGENFSVGQKQLVCLARAVLRKNRIIVLDEATANVDPRTDARIQKTIKDKFSNGNCTVITIAHRLNTIMDYDKVLVLDKGSLVEFGPPWTLLQNENGFFSELVQSTGGSCSNVLRSAAETIILKLSVVPPTSSGRLVSNSFIRVEF